ncbi:hypothetical protein EST38_g12074 [Candolleomyces aberdarensis]|uniref:Reverse transcriptase domain-containing protein n=1 Tax=Candolleomyces aberdarensis TaxID=2316362 RepID=A0A4Q2D3B5_9AGAR|nr:hypothetical protein EST38_g12074 [Candolleomyces aberdarensis]
MVEDSVDRLPTRSDRDGQINALQELKRSAQLIDGWRNENPNQVAYTWSQKNVNREHLNAPLSKSRIDRIYINENLLRTTNEWEIRTDHPIDTDHELVSVKYYDLQTPYLGKGRWELPNYLLDHKHFMEEVHKLCSTAVGKAETSTLNRQPFNNPQLVLTDLKREILATAKRVNRENTPKIRAKIDCLRNKLNDTLNETTTDDLTKSIEAAKLEEEIKTTETQRHNQLRLSIHTKYFLENETIGKVWIQANKEKKPRDTLWGLKDPQNPEGPLATTTREMTRIAATYHENIQSKDLPNLEENEQVITEVLANINRKTDAKDKQNLSKPLEYEEVYEALISMPNGKASGLDGIPTELWKNLASEYQKAVAAGTKPEDLPPDLVRLLLLVYNDIEKHGINPDSNFAEGWMCPIYKKKDKTDIANYRPITVLNADYKTFTKALTIKLAPTALKIIHPDQAGFLKGRRIDDHTELIKLMIRWCEAEDENGLLVFLDQEKAYDKITHEFLNRSLQAFEIPDSFRNTIMGLYKNAFTTVIINGVKSEAFKITRGVRQGDPLSCLLFNLAIESLASMLRNSNLEGFKVNKEIDRIITTLFADDTTVYLSKNDSLNELESILKKWCSASGAKFNVDKTEIIPVGHPDYRANIVRDRTIPNSQNERIPDRIHIAKDREPIRALGAFVGNKVDNAHKAAVTSPS